MKIDKKSPKHWVYLFRFGVVVCLGLILRGLVSRPKKPIVVLYGHKLNGNLKALYDDIIKNHKNEVDIVFLTMDEAYEKQLRSSNIQTANANHIRTASMIARISCVVSDHGLHCLKLATYFSGIKFVDVWHGIPFKGFDKDDFKTQHKYTQVWVSSKKMSDIYVNKFGFRRDQIRVTGYARIDSLIKNVSHKEQILEELDLPKDRNYILYAPTWQQDDDGRSIFPFQLSEEQFIRPILEVCQATHSTLLLRTHLNTSYISNIDTTYLKLLPHDDYPDTEKILAISNLLLCDWSSIAFDFLVLKRPTIFLDVPAPFKKGFTLGPDYRFGSVVKDIASLESEIKKGIVTPELFVGEFGQRLQDITSELYDATTGSSSSNRYYNELIKLIRTECR